MFYSKLRAIPISRFNYSQVILNHYLKVVCVLFLDESSQDDAAAKANPSLTREKDLVVNISDLDNIFDEDEEELGVRHHGLCAILIHFSTNSV